jgi:hypothetical protein
MVVATGSWLREKSGAQAVLTVASAGWSWILSPAPLLCRRVGASPCLMKGCHPLHSWTGRSRRIGTARQRWQRGAGAHAQRGWKSRAMAERAERRKTSSFHRWTAAADKGDLRRRTWDCRPVGTAGDRSGNSGRCGGHNLGRWRSLATPGGPWCGSTWGWAAQ